MAVMWCNPLTRRIGIGSLNPNPHLTARPCGSRARVSTAVPGPSLPGLINGTDAEQVRAACVQPHVEPMPQQRPTRPPVNHAGETVRKVECRAGKQIPANGNMRLRRTGAEMDDDDSQRAR